MLLQSQTICQERFSIRRLFTYIHMCMHVSIKADQKDSVQTKTSYRLNENNTDVFLFLHSDRGITLVLILFTNGDLHENSLIGLTICLFKIFFTQQVICVVRCVRYPLSCPGTLQKENIGFKHLMKFTILFQNRLKNHSS